MAVPVIELFTSNSQTFGSTTIVATKPAGVVTGDLLVILASTDSTAASGVFVDDITGWNFGWSEGSASVDVHIGMYWRIADGTEGATETVTSSGTADKVVFYLRISGVNATQLDATGTAGLTSGNTSETIALNSTVNDCLVIAHIGIRDGDTHPVTTSTTDWTLEASLTSLDSSVGTTGAFASRSLASAGSSGTMTFDVSPVSPATNKMFAIAPAEAAEVPGDNAIFLAMNF